MILGVSVQALGVLRKMFPQISETWLLDAAFHMSLITEDNSLCASKPQNKKTKQNRKKYSVPQKHNHYCNDEQPVCLSLASGSVINLSPVQK